MRGQRPKQPSFVSLINVETLIPGDHPVRVIKRMCDEILGEMDEMFDEIYAADGAPSVPPETLLKGKVLQALYSVRSDRQLCARLQTDLLFRWFVDLPLEAAVFDASTYSKNQDRLLKHEVADVFFAEVVALAKRHGWVSDDHFSVDGTLIESWGSLKSFRPKGDSGPKDGDGNSWGDFKGTQRRNDTHASTSDPEAKLLRKGAGKEAKLCFAAHAAMENRHGLCVLFEVRPSVGEDESESKAAVANLMELQNRGFAPKSVGADKGYHDEVFMAGCQNLGIEPRPAMRKDRPHLAVIATLAYQASQKCRKRIEEIFGWVKTIGCLRKSRYRGVERTHAQSQFVVASCNLVRMAKLFTTAAPPAATAGA
jgi:transposase